MAASTNQITNQMTNGGPTTNDASSTNAPPTGHSTGFEWPTNLHDVFSPSTMLGAFIDAVIILLIACLIARLLNLTIKRVLSRPKHIPSDPTAIRFLGQLAQAGVYIFAFLTYAHLVPALRSMGDTWLASVGVVSVVIGLAAQSTLGNLIAGISLLLYRPFNLGDSIQVNAPSGLETGTVESLNLGYTILRTPDYRRIVIPNNTMASNTSVNLSGPGNRLMCQVPINIAPDTDLDRARNILQDLLKQQTKTREFVGAPVTAISNNSVTITLKVWCDSFQDVTELKGELLEGIRKRFKAENIELR